MPSTVAKRLPDGPRKMLSMGSETARKNLSDPDERREFGRIVERAIQIAGWSKQEAATAFGYENQTVIARWFSGAEPVQIARVWSVRRFRQPLLIAIAEAARPDATVRHTIEIVGMEVA